MVNKKQLRIINFIMCLAITAFTMPIEAVAMDSPTGSYIAEFPMPGNPDTVITDNYGTIDYAKTYGSISYNYYLIKNLEGATVGENKSGGIIDQFIAGRVENNYGTINKVNNTASVGTNAPSGVIKDNFNNVDKNVGKIENQHSGTIKENYGNVGTIGQGAKIEKLYEGTITENSGTVDIQPAPEGILTLVKIGTNKGTVRIEADSEKKSSVVIDSNDTGATLYVCSGADCTVTNNAGTIEIEEGGTCNIVGTNSGTVNGTHTTSGEEYNYKLILDNINSSDITFVEFFKKVGDEIYVKGEGQDCNVIVAYDTNRYFCSNALQTQGVMCIPIENTEDSTLDSTNHTFTIHFHTYSWVRGNGKHKQVCAGCGHTESVGDCSYGEWIIDSEAKVGVAGRKHRVCSVCSGVENATIPAKADNGNKKADSNEQGGNEPDIKPTKNDDTQVVNSTKKNTTQVVNALSDSDAILKVDNANSDEETNSNSDGRDEEMQTVDSMDIASDSETAFGDLESSEQEMDETAGLENGESGKSKIAVIVGVSAFATAAAAGYFVFSRKNRR